MTADPFFYARDNDTWYVCGPNGMKVVCNDKCLAYMLAALLNGHVDDAVKMAADYVRWV